MFGNFRKFFREIFSEKKVIDTHKKRITSLKVYLIIILFFLNLSLLIILFLKPVGTAYLPVDVFISNLTDSTATISWSTRRPAESKVLLSESADFPIVPIFSKSYKDDKDKGLKDSFKYYTHHITVENLNPGTTYRFGIYHGVKKLRQVRFETALKNEVLHRSKIISGKIVRADSKVPGANVYFRSRTANSSSQLLSTISNSEGTWILDIGSLKVRNLEKNFTLSKDTRQEITIDATPYGRYEMSSKDPGQSAWPTVTLREKE